MGETADAHPEGVNWARYVRWASTREGMNVTRLAKLSGVGRSTLNRHLANDGTRVTVATATAIARAVGDDPANALSAAGSLITDDAPPIPSGVDLLWLDARDPIVAAILTGPFEVQMQNDMIKYEADRREQRRKEIEMTAQALRRRDLDTDGDGVD